MRPAQGQNGNVYNPSCALEEEFASLARKLIRHHHDAFVDLGRGALSIQCRFRFTPDTGSILAKPDIDNLVKFVLDMLSGVLFHDDPQITNLRADKDFDLRFGSEGFTMVTIRRV